MRKAPHLYMVDADGVRTATGLFVGGVVDADGELSNHRAALSTSFFCRSMEVDITNAGVTERQAFHIERMNRTSDMSAAASASEVVYNFRRV